MEVAGAVAQAASRAASEIAAVPTSDFLKLVMVFSPAVGLAPNWQRLRSSARQQLIRCGKQPFALPYWGNERHKPSPAHAHGRNPNPRR
jgi:hypothetical protein